MRKALLYTKYIVDMNL